MHIGETMTVALLLFVGLGGTPEEADKARDMIGTLKPEAVLATSMAALVALKSSPVCTGNAGAVGFCWLGWSGG